LKGKRREKRERVKAGEAGEGFMSIVRFEDLECWQRAVDLAVNIYEESCSGELGKDFGLRDQLRRAAVSISSNIAEGKERETVPEFIRYLYIAKGSAGELRTQLTIAGRIGHIQKEKVDLLKSETEKIGAMIGNLIKRLKGKK
jgi:four helix bundle protein